MTRISLKVLFAVFSLTAGFCAVGSAQTAETSTSSLGTISGRVSTPNGDLPNNTIVFASPPLSIIQPRSAVVNGEGLFKLDNLEAGVYRVWAAAPGFIGDVPPQPIESRGLYRTGDTVNLSLRKGGVITGTVRKGNDDPVVAVNVRAFRVRDEYGKPLNTINAANERFTDDRGVYRIYGLIPGTYIVAAGGTSRFFGGLSSGFDQDVPTYAPSSTRDTAMEVIVRSGEEATADIQYRGEPGHAISGSVSGVPQAVTGMTFGSASINITDVKSKTIIMSAIASSSVNDYAFAAYGLPDGEYELVAQSFSQTRDLRASEPKHVKVQGADVTGVNLNVATLPAINGRVLLDTSLTADCVKHRETALQETIIFARRDKQTTKPTDANSAANDQVAIIFAEQIAEASGDAKGEFTLRNLHAGTYRISVTLPGPGWYVKSLTRASNPRTPDTRIVSDGLTLSSQSISGLTVTLSEGAASIRGVVVTSEGKTVKQRLILYLVPVEKENASNLLRYFETRSDADGKFALRNIPPGEYFALAQTTDENRPAGFLIRQDSNLRDQIVRDAQKLKQTVAAKPCERLDDYNLTLSATP